MGHRALIIIEDPDTGLYSTRGSHWGASGARYLGASYEQTIREGTAHQGAYPTLDEVASECIDFLFHEAVYLARPGYPTKAYDTIWWKGARNYVDSPRGVYGVGAIVELYDTLEWGSFSRLSYATPEDEVEDPFEENILDHYLPVDEMTAQEFHDFIRKSDFADRVPEWSPMGADKYHLPEVYHDFDTDHGMVVA